MASWDSHSNVDYARLFPELPPWEPEGKTDEEKLDSLWKLAESMYSGSSEDNPDIPAGYTYFGQLINHDLSHEEGSSLRRASGPAELRNLRSPRFDLDCVYGAGPEAQPFLYERLSQGKLLLGSNENDEYDLPRNLDSTSENTPASVDIPRTALIGDARNDENIMISQLHLAVIRFHNRLVGEQSFEEARRLTRWHYQWVAIHDFLKRLCGSNLVDKLLESHLPNRFYPGCTMRPLIPVEFSMAAFRVGHSMVRESYHLNETLMDSRSKVPHSLFHPYKPQNSLHGGRELPRDWTVQWDLFVTHEKSKPQKSMLIDDKLAPPLRELPLQVSDSRLRSLAYLTLVRGWRMGLPSGQEVARRMREKPLAGNDPLWVYILRESGKALGPVGARIVAEVFTNLLAADPDSYFTRDPQWKPTKKGEYELHDFLVDAGVPMTKKQWQEERHRPVATKPPCP